MKPRTLAEKLAMHGLLPIMSGIPLDAPDSKRDSIETSLHAENLALRDRLRALGIAAHFDFYGPGTHTWPYWQRELHRSWTLLASAQDAAPVQ
jgi:diacylglycerol O-acyltransferase / trehalose O-mycolyltransferase